MSPEIESSKAAYVFSPLDPTKFFSAIIRGSRSSFMTIIIFISEQLFGKREFDNFVKKIINQKQKIMSKKLKHKMWK